MTLEEQYLQMYQISQALEEELALLPAGWIEHDTKNDQIYEYYRYRDNGRKCYGDPEVLVDMKKAIERRNYLRLQRRQLKSEMIELRHQLRSEGLQPASIIRKYNFEQAKRKKQELANQKEQIHASRKKHSKNYKHRTTRGELVASKSEMMIANTLFRMRLSYQYEQELLLFPNITLHPDFTIFNNGKTYFWEHLGRMDDPEYRKDWYKRKEKYEENGIIVGVNLIVTTETQDIPLTQEQIELVLKTHLNVKL